MTLIQSIEFLDGVIQVTYYEERDTDTDKGIIEARTLLIPIGLVEDKVEELLDDARQLVDEALLIRRAPTASFSRPR